MHERLDARPAFASDPEAPSGGTGMQRAQRGVLTAEVIDEQTRALAAPLQEATGSVLALLCFRVAGERFALPATSVERVFVVPSLRRVPHRKKAAFRGMVAHEGEILLVGSIERLLDLPPVPTADPSQARMILLGPAGRGWAFEVAGVDGVMQVRAADTRPAPATVTRGLGSATRRLVPLTDGEACLLDPQALCAGWEACAS